MIRIMSHGSPLYAFSHTTHDTRHTTMRSVTRHTTHDTRLCVQSHDTLEIFITIIALYNY